MESVNRRRFLTRVGAVSGAAAFVGIPGLSTSEITEHPIEEVTTPGPVSKEPVVVYMRDAGRGEVTVFHGTRRDDVSRSRAGASACSRPRA